MNRTAERRSRDDGETTGTTYSGPTLARIARRTANAAGYSELRWELRIDSHGPRLIVVCYSAPRIVGHIAHVAL